MTEHSTQTGAWADAVLKPHTTIDQLSASARSVTEPRDAAEVIDAYESVVSRHLGSVRSAMLPIAEKQVPDGAERVAAYLSNARSLEQAVRALKAFTCGDVTEHHQHPEQLWHEVEACMRTHVELEEDLVRELTEVLDTSSCAALSEEVHAAANNAPTAPRPSGSQEPAGDDD